MLKYEKGEQFLHTAQRWNVKMKNLMLKSNTRESIRMYMTNQIVSCEMVVQIKVVELSYFK